MTPLHLQRTLLTAAVVLSLSACGTQNVDKDQSVVIEQTTTPAPQVKPAAKIEAKPADSITQHTADRQAQETVTAESSLRGLEESARSRPEKSTLSSTDSALVMQSAKPAAGIVAPMTLERYASEPADRENYHVLDDNGVQQVAQNPVSTFSIDVDTGAYANVRRFLNQGQLPRTDAVRVEEMINYFSYDYPFRETSQPFSVITEVAPTPWNPNSHLLHIGIQGDPKSDGTLPPSNLVFLVDVSGSMRSHDKLDLLKTSLKMLTRQLKADDRISLVVYAGASGVVLPPTPGNETATISHAIDNLYAGGSTNGAEGIRLAYQMAEQAFIKNGINRILLATDGDFNVGTVNFDALQDLVEEKRKTGISLTTLGFGTGNYNDHLMEQLADKGNGNYAYIDTINEAQKVLVDQRRSTLQTIAKDVKIQIEFNPDMVAEYRLIGYENRALKQEDFNNDKIDAGEIGAGHSVTALYEIVLSKSSYRQMDALRYQTEKPSKSSQGTELAYLKLRYKQPEGTSSRLITHIIDNKSVADTITNASESFRFATAVAAFGQQLRGGKYTGKFTLGDTLAMARTAKGSDPFGYRGEFIRLVNLAMSLNSPIAQKHDE